MIRRPPGSTRTDTPLPSTTRFPSSDPLPARADLRAVVGPVKDAIGGRVFRVRWFGGNDGQLAVKGERMNTAHEVFVFGGELTDLGHDSLLGGEVEKAIGGHRFRRWESGQRVGVRHS